MPKDQTKGSSVVINYLKIFSLGGGDRERACIYIAVGDISITIHLEH